MKKVMIICTLLSISTFVLTGCSNQIETNNTEAQMDANSTTENFIADKIEIIDFHGTRRCYSCQTIEQYARETLEEYFQDELASGRITFQSINGELSENQAVVLKYQARGSSLFINAIKDGEDNIEENTMVWRLVNDEQGFKEYFKGVIGDLLE